MLNVALNNIPQWSYGVLLWELFSFGALPYKGLENMAIENYLLEGGRMEKPKGTPDYM